MRVWQLIALAWAAPGLAQVPLPLPVQPGPPQEQPLLQNDLRVKAGSDRIFFAGNNAALSPQSRQVLMAHARWLIANPGVRAVLEGHGDERDSRDHAIAVGERRASAARDYLISLGVPAVRLSVTSWGKERPAQSLPGLPPAVSARVVTLIVR